MRKILLCFSLFISFVVLIILSSCSNDSDAKIISSGDIVFNDKIGILIVSNATEDYELGNVIEVSQGAKWVLSKTKYGDETIPTKVAPLNVGDNTFYIVITSKDESKVELYSLTIRRHPMYILEFDACGGTMVESQTIEEDKELEKGPNTSRVGYSFGGWILGNELVSFPYKVTKAVSMKANWIPNKNTTYKINHYKQNYDGTYSTTPSEVEYSEGTTGENTKALAKNYKGHNQPAVEQKEILGNGSTEINIYYPKTKYSFIDENTLCYGYYPQSLVDDKEICSNLNSISGTLPTESNKNKWTDYGYYVSNQIESYMFFIDIDIDNDGLNDYRGVYFTDYRPYRTGDSHSNNFYSRTNYEKENVYWFKYEPIEWTILNKSKGKALIISNLLLDSQPYSSYGGIDIPAGVYNPNNYEHSYIRDWLSNYFYKYAFVSIEKEIINNTVIDNSLSSTGMAVNNYCCNNTTDKVFLASYKEMSDFYSSKDMRRIEATDYAIIQGIVSDSNKYCRYWLRSPGDTNAQAGGFIDENGEMNSGLVTCIYFGIRPLCWITL